jgi:nicotinamidase-related amidase
MPPTIDPGRTALLLLDYQHDNITATPGIAEARVLEHSARVLEAARPDELVINKTCVDPFLTTNLGQAPINFDVNTLVLIGLWTNFVVEPPPATPPTWAAG